MKKDCFLSRCRVIKLSLIELEMFGARILTFNSFHLKWFCSICSENAFHYFNLIYVVVFGKCLMKKEKILSVNKTREEENKNGIDDNTTTAAAFKNKAWMLYLNASQFYWIHAPLFINTAFHCSRQHCQFLYVVFI